MPSPRMDIPVATRFRHSRRYDRTYREEFPISFTQYMGGRHFFSSLLNTELGLGITCEEDLLRLSCGRYDPIPT